eukprot:TRINITY_DN6645_c0_g2_i2.p1 TRINITY_DN6645_c0_g2~~TRINITY_DN6645_c0_g2_i2.p1  ORF type:complete len:218 (-),score=21.53 TRINITY_DN6645_c0_g2_i2:92-745(-)
MWNVVQAEWPRNVVPRSSLAWQQHSQGRDLYSRDTGRQLQSTQTQASDSEYCSIKPFTASRTHHGEYQQIADGLTLEGRPSMQESLCGKHCAGRKFAPGKMGSSVIRVRSRITRDAILDYVRSACGPYADAFIYIRGVPVTLTNHVDKYAKCELPTDIYVSWSNRIEKESPLPLEDLLEVFDSLVDRCVAHSGPPNPADVPIWAGFKSSVKDQAWRA